MYKTSYEKLEDKINALNLDLENYKKKINNIIYSLDTGNFSDDYITDVQTVTRHIASLQDDVQNIKFAKIGEARIENAAINTAKIADLAVNSAKIAVAGVESANIKDGAISNAKIQNLAVDNAKLGVASVQEANIADLSVSSGKIQNLAVKTAHIALGAITSALIESGAIGTAQIANGSITDAKIVELTANKITAGTLEVARLIITGGGSIVEAINKQNGTSQLSINTVDGGALTDRTITADKIVAKAITAGELASKTISANEIMANAITGAEINANSVEARHIKAGEISADKLSSNVGEVLNISGNQAIISKVSTNDMNTAIKQSSDSITQIISRAESKIDVTTGNLNTLAGTISTWIRFNAEGMELGKSDSPFTAKMGNEKLSFLENGLEIAYFANNQMFINRAEITEKLSIGKANFGFDWQIKNNGLMLRKI